jgi:hypothetical protein
MDEIKTFIAEARGKGLDDDTIRKSLEAKEWDASSINIALLGLEAPAPTAPAAAQPTTPASNQNSLSHLMAALHHVILWFFTASSTVTIGGTVASLYGMGVSANALASMIAVTVITFSPYAVLFAIFLGKNRKNPPVVPGKVWSIITICLHSVGAMTAAIIAVINIVTNGDQMYLVSAGLVLLLDLIVVTTYLFAAFGLKLRRAREIMIALHLPLLIIMFGILFTLSLVNLGPAKHDEDLRKDLSTLVHDIAGRTREQNKLPDSIDGLTKNSSITYKKTSNKKYQVCATFQTTGNFSPSSSYYGGSYEATDDFVTESDFAAGKGEHCFDFTSSYLKDKETQNTPLPNYNY